MPRGKKKKVGRPTSQQVLVKSLETELAHYRRELDQQDTRIHLVRRERDKLEAALEKAKLKLEILYEVLFKIMDRVDQYNREEVNDKEH